MEDHPKFEYSQITDQIFLGTSLCCGTHHQEIKNLGVEADIDLEEERSGGLPKIRIYLWLPVKDLQAPTQSQIRTGVALMDEILSQGKKIYVHCRAGHGRSPTLVAAYFIFKGKTRQEAVAEILAKRPEVHLLEDQVAALMQYEKYLKEKR